MQVMSGGTKASCPPRHALPSFCILAAEAREKNKKSITYMTAILKRKLGISPVGC